MDRGLPGDLTPGSYPVSSLLVFCEHRWMIFNIGTTQMQSVRARGCSVILLMFAALPFLAEGVLTDRCESEAASVLSASNLVIALCAGLPTSAISLDTGHDLPVQLALCPFLPCIRK